MDVARPDLARKKKLRQGLYAGSAAVVVILITAGVSQLQPAAPRVDADTVFIDTVQRGPMVREVRGTGSLVPETIRWIPAVTDGTVDRIVIRPGATIEPGTVILE
ncbi:MAG: RND transporter, partial [Acidobacteria bacterium]|nr:RND transporter [Acidobacteriota bacterium]MYJ05699.1 RND transporter [Acidobacteriota bacterium]